MAYLRGMSLAAAVMAGLSVAGVVLNTVLILGNQRAEAEVQARQQFINQSLQINQFNNALIQSLGTAAVSGKDAAIQGLLAEFGISVSANQPANAAPDAARPAAK